MAYEEDRPRSNSNELILNPGEYAFLQDKTTGNVQTHVGPLVVTQSGQLRPIKLRKGKFEETQLQDSVEQCVAAAKGEYLVLHNPTIEDDGVKDPAPKNTNASVPELRYGEKIVVPGPVQIALWPEQVADVVEGHNLRADQFLLVRIYDEAAAAANWSDAIVQGGDEDTVVTKTADALGLTLGKLLVIKGVSFYIPPTGVEVVPGDEGFVRDALTLEMSEYAILVDQSGNRRYERGPQIVFPEPTEEFLEEDGQVKFKPQELTPTQGIHIKFNCDYEDLDWPEGAQKFKEGDEVFITGKTHPIYYPQEEHSIVKYGGNAVHYATAVSAGQARYVMNKDSGVITTREGPDMILLDPTKEVFVQRVLSDSESLLMYPGNQDSLEYNQSLRRFKLESGLESVALEANFSDEGKTRKKGLSQKEMCRKTTYTKPHSVTLDDRFSGVPKLNVWTGFAVLLVQADGTRRVEVGPKVVHLKYDETVSGLHLSTGKPKTTDHLLTTGYLEVENNKVSDILDVETADGFNIRLKVSYRVSFEGKPEDWFNVDNYVKFFTDHCRSRLKGVARQQGIREFYSDTVDILRDTVLGVKGDGPREGMKFEENGMRVTEVDLLDVKIMDSEVADLLVDQQQVVMRDQIAIDRATQRLEVETAEQEVELKRLQLADELRQANTVLTFAKFADKVAVAEHTAAEDTKRAKEKTELAKERELANDVAFQAEFGRSQETQVLALEKEKAETAQMVARFDAAKGDLAAAIRELGDEQVLAKVAEAMGPMRLIGGGTITDAIAGLIGDSDLLKRLTK